MNADADLGRWLRRVGAADALLGLATLLPGMAVVVVDADRRVLAWAGEAERLLGWRREDVLGQPCPNGVVCDGFPDADARPFGAVVRVRRADGTHLVARHYVRRFEHGGLHLLVPLADGADPPVAAPPDAVEFHGIVTRDPGMLRVLETVRNVAETDATVLVRGESGTGKELVARAIHAESRRRAAPFVAVNCAAFPPTLLESELFGHEKGAFTGATERRDGIFAQADGGTLFLDEVAELSPDLQAKLLRVLQDRTFVPVGGRRPVRVDVRILAATHEALRQRVREGRFREDLLYRLRVVPIFLPPLRERRLDVDLLLRKAIERQSALGPRRVARVAPDAMRALLEHDWPGNVRELLNVVEYAFAVGRGPEITLDELPPELREPRPPARRRRGDAEAEAEAVREAIARADGDLQRAADLLGVSRVTLWRRRRRLGL